MWIGKLNIVKMSIVPKAVDTVNAIPPKIPWYFPPKTEQILLISVGNHKGPQIAKATLRKENRLEASPSLTSIYIMKLKAPKKCGIGTETGTQTREPRKKPTGTWSVNSQKKEPRTYTRERTVPSVNGAGENGRHTPRNNTG